MNKLERVTDSFGVRMSLLCTDGDRMSNDCISLSPLGLLRVCLAGARRKEGKKKDVYKSHRIWMYSFGGLE